MEQKANGISSRKPAYYLFDAAVLKKRIEYLKKRLPDQARLCYAVKANPFIVKEIGHDVDRFECCSPGEARICVSMAIDPEKLVISGVYKTPEIIEEMVADESFSGIFTIESMRQFTLLSELSEKYKRTVRVLLRLTNNSQFGLNASEIESLISERNEHRYLHIIGIQFFSGTQKSSVKKIKREIEMLDCFLTKLEENSGFKAEELEYGPGFPVAYFESDMFDEDAFLSAVNDILQSMRNKPVLTLELGRSIAASCGKYFTSIVDMKTNCGQPYLLVDGGMHHITYYGQSMAMKHPMVSVVGKENEPGEKEWSVCGSLCSMNDIIVKNMLLPPVNVGDVLCFENSGAYCMTEGISLFLSRELPEIYLKKEGGDIVCVRRTFETDVLNSPNYDKMKG
ncbi:MAG: alanine racemase [Clostridia bacterium]|nr:alanine racemase [Clostridia bacterium]